MKTQNIFNEGYHPYTPPPKKKQKKLNKFFFVFFRVLVGAPESETEQARWGVHKPGAVLRYIGGVYTNQELYSGTLVGCTQTRSCTKVHRWGVHKPGAVHR